MTAAPAATVSGDSLPDGVTLSTAGVLSGTPTRAGAYAVTLTAINTVGTPTKTQRLTVNPGATGMAKVAQPPASVQPGAWESDTEFRVFGEQMNRTLAAPLSVGGTTIPAGTRVNSYYVHADAVGNANTAHLFTGSLNFGTRVLAVASTGRDLQATAPTFGLPGTTYSTSGDQGLEYNDSATVVGGTVNISLNVYSTSDAVRIITEAP